MHYTKITSTITMLYGQLSPATLYKLQAVVTLQYVKCFIVHFTCDIVCLLANWCYQYMSNSMY